MLSIWIQIDTSLCFNAGKDEYLKKKERVISPMQEALLDQKSNMNTSQSQVYDAEGSKKCRAI